MGRRISLSLVVALGLLLCAELLLRFHGDRIGEPQFWYSPRAQDAAEQIDELDAARSPVDTALVGSSMVEFGLRPEILERELDSVDWVVNVGIPKGYTTVTERWVLEEIVARLEPSRVVWGLSSLDFNGFRPVPALPQYEAARAGATGVFGSIDRALWQASMLSRYRELLRGPASLLNLLDAPATQSSESVPLEDLLTPTVWPDIAQTPAAFRSLTNSVLADFGIAETHRLAFTRTVEALQQQDLDVVLVLLPVTSEYIEAHPEGQDTFDEFVAWFLDQAGDLGVPVFDYSRLVPADEFLDYNHVTPEGATLLTQALAADLAELGW